MAVTVPAFANTADLNYALNSTTSDTVAANPASQGTAFISDTSASTGNDTLTLGKHGSLLTTSKIFDSNSDNRITFNAVTDTLQSDRTTAKNYGQGDTIKFTDVDGNSGLRYLGEREGFFVYADYAVKKALLPQGNVIEGTVNDNVFTGTAAKDIFFFDTALGLNLGHDRINGFSATDELVTTTQIFDRDSDGQIRFGGNRQLNTPGDQGNEDVRTTGELGGLVALYDTTGHQIRSIYLENIETINGVTYYHYGLTPSA